jgi:hypothetical protein
VTKGTKGFRIDGSVTTRETGRPVAGALVEALDRDLVFDDRLGAVATDAQGQFVILYAREDFSDLFLEKKPDIYLRVRRPDGRVVFTSEDKVRYAAGRTEHFHILVSEKDFTQGECAMNYTIKLTLDLDKINADPELKKDFLQTDKPMKVAAVRDGQVLASVALDTRNIDNYKKVPVTLEYSLAADTNPGAYLVIGPNVSDREFVAIDARKLWIAPRQFKANVADLSKQVIGIDRYLVRRWLLLCRTFTVTGRVVQPVGDCENPVPGATVQIYDADCWWFWYRRDVITSTTTQPDGSFEVTFRWCCLIRIPPLIKRPWIIDPDLLAKVAAALQPKIGPIPPETLKDPAVFERFLADRLTLDAVGLGGVNPALQSKAGLMAPSLPLPPPASARVATTPAVDARLAAPMRNLAEVLRPILPFLPCWPFVSQDCTPDLVFRVTQECGGDVKVIYDETPAQIRWNVPTTVNVTLFASDEACSVVDPLCHEPPAGDCLKFSHVNCVTVENIGGAALAGPPDLRGYAYPLATDNPFADAITIKGRFGASSNIDYFKPQYSYNDGPFQDFPETHLLAFSRNYWGPPPGAVDSTVVKPNDVLFKAEDVDGRKVYKTLDRAEAEIPLPPDWTWGYLWNDMHTLFRWNSVDLEGDGLYTIKLVGYRYDAVTKTLKDEHDMLLCEVPPTALETVPVRIDNRLAPDPSYMSTSANPCGSGYIHQCVREPDCDFTKLEWFDASAGTTSLIHACDIIDLAAGDKIHIYIDVSDPDGHLDQYTLRAHWGDSAYFDVLARGTFANPAAEPLQDPLYGPSYGATFLGSQGVYRAGLPATAPEHGHPVWYGGRSKITLDYGDFDASCAYTLMLRVWKRTIVGCQLPIYNHVNWNSLSLTINKV